MRTKSLVTALALVLAGAALSGCCSVFCSGGMKTAVGGPAVLPGVAEIFRNNGTMLVGYVSADPNNNNWSWWLLNDGESPPTIPQSLAAPGSYVVFHLITDVPMDGMMLCSNYKGNLMNPTLWKLVQDSAAKCP